MNTRAFFLVMGLTGLTIWTAGQGGLKPKPGDPLPPKPGPRGPGLPQLQPKLPLPDRTKPMIDPFQGRTLILREKLETTSLLTPGDEVAYAPPSAFDIKASTLLLEDDDSQELYELPIEAFQRVTTKPSKYTHGNVRLPSMYSVYGFVAPQVPRGKYHVYYRQGETNGPKKGIEIHPKLNATGRRIGAVDGRAVVIVRPVGPPLTPRKLKTRVSGGAPGGRTLEGLVNVDMEPEVVRPTIQLQDFSNTIAPEGSENIRADESGQARFGFRLKQSGRATANFVSPGFDGDSTVIVVRARNVPPEVEEPGRNLRLVCIGDSLAWGQGLKESHKFSSKTADRMKALTGRNVTRTVFAHSGGTILSQKASDEDRRLPGEVPVWFPSIPHQAELAAAAVSDKSVDVVLVDGGTNDVGVFDIINPFVDNRKAIRKKARAMREAIRHMLVDIGQTFAYRKSFIVFTGSYRIITMSSKIEEMATGFATIIALTPLPGATVAGVVAEAVLLGILAARKDDIAEQNTIFKDELQSATIAAIQDASNDLGTNGEDRIVFVDPGLSASQAYAASNSKLWLFGIEDEVAGQRAIDGAPYALESNQFLVASAGHPTVEGAQIFADKISAAITPESARTIWDATRARRKMTVSISRTITVPSGATGIEVPFQVTARDSATGANLPGNVFINGEFVGRTGTQITRFFRRVNAQNPKPTILVSRPGYGDGVLSYEIG